jgi:radical SAM superfamily enzyme YgiQ (UPF0313 family)
MKESNLLILNLPSPSEQLLLRDSAGGYGIIIPTNIRRSKYSNIYPNPFLFYSAAVAQDMNFDYNVIDAQILKLSENKLIEAVKKFDPDIIFSMISLPSIYSDLMMLDKIKSEIENTLVVGCGTVCKTLPNEILENSSVDIITRDFFPYVNGLRDLLKKFPLERKYKDLSGFSYIQDNELKHTSLKSTGLEYYDYKPLFRELPLEKYWHYPDSEGRKRLLVPILGALGCPHHCSYCPYSIGFGEKIRYNNPKSIANEIEDLCSYGIDYFLFRNQSFTFNYDWAKSVCNEIKKRKLDIEWICEARIDETNKDILGHMWNSGCKRILFGVETGDPSLMQKVKPGINLRNVKDVFKLTKKMGFWRIASIILGFPDENKMTLNRTKKFVLNLKPDSISINFLTPYPGTKLYEVAKRNKWINTKNWKHYTSFNPVMTLPDLSVKDLYHVASQIRKKHLLEKGKKRIIKNLNFHSVKNLLSVYFNLDSKDLEASWI